MKIILTKLSFAVLSQLTNDGDGEVAKRIDDYNANYDIVDKGSYFVLTEKENDGNKESTEGV
jgi:hypothetical protein